MKKHHAIFSFTFLNLTRNLIGLVRSKYIAVAIGVNQVGALGQVISFFNFQTRFISAGSRVSIITLLKAKNKEEQFGIIIANLILISITNLAFIILSLLWFEKLNLFLFKNLEYARILKLMIIFSPIFAVKELLETVYQAKQEFKTIAKAQLIAQTIALASILPLIYFFDLIGVAYNLIFWFSSQVILLCLYSLPKIKYYRISIRLIFHSLNISIKHSSVNLVREIMQFFAFLVLPAIIVQAMNLREAGYFFALFSISNYLNIILQAISYVLLPTLRSINFREKFKEELNKNFVITIYLIFPIIFILMVFPNYTLLLLYSNEFLDISNLLLIILFAKAIEVYFSYYLLIFMSIANIQIYFPLDMLRSILFVAIPWIFLMKYELEGVLWGIVITYVICTCIIELLKLKKPELRLSKQNTKLTFKLAMILISILIFSHYAIFNTFIRIILILVTFIYILDYRRYKSYIKNILKKRRLNEA